MAGLRGIAAFVASLLDWVLINVFAGSESSPATLEEEAPPRNVAPRKCEKAGKKG
jgi:hypothetical protein